MSDDQTPIDLLWDATEKFQTTIFEAVKISDGALGVEHTGRQNRSLFIFAKLIAHCMAMSVLVEKFRNAPEGAALLDHFSIATLARAVIDAALMVMYISEPRLTRDEWDLRRQVLFLHDLTNRKRFLTAVGRAGGPRDFAFFESYEELKIELRGKIRGLVEGLGYPGERADELVKGQTIFIEGGRGAAREAGWDVDAFEFHQAYLSNWVHSHPVSFLRADEYGISFSKPSAFQIAFSASVIDICTGCLEDATKRMGEFTGRMEADPVGQLD